MGVTVAELVLLKKSHLLLVVLGDRVGQAGQLGNGLAAEKEAFDVIRPFCQDPASHS